MCDAKLFIGKCNNHTKRSGGRVFLVLGQLYSGGTVAAMMELQSWQTNSQLDQVHHSMCGFSSELECSDPPCPLNQTIVWMVLVETGEINCPISSPEC